MVSGRLYSAATSGRVEPGLNADLSPSRYRGLPDGLSAEDLTQDLSSLACPVVTGSPSHSISLLGCKFRFAIIHPVGHVPTLMEVTFQQRWHMGV